MTLRDSVVVIAGAAGSAGPAIARRLSGAGATVVLAGRRLVELEPIANEIAAAGGAATADAVDLLDEHATTQWSAEVLRRHGRVDGLVHLVGGWRGGKGFPDMDLADWTALEGPLVRTVQHTSRAFYDALLAGPHGRFVLVSAVAAARPTAPNAAYAAAKAAAEAWTLALADSFTGSQAAATILVVKALVTPAMRTAKPTAAFAGYTEVSVLADTVAQLWDEPAQHNNGERVWLAT